MGMYFWGQVWKRVWKMEYFGLKLGQDLGNRRHTPTKNSEEYSPPRGEYECMKHTFEPQVND